MTEQANAVPITRQAAPADLSVIEKLIAQGDLSSLSPAERTRYYIAVCERAGVSPVGQPLEYLKLQGKLILYATKRFTDQVREAKQISVTRVEREVVDDLYIVTTYAQTPDGRIDSDVGAVSLGQQKGEARANAIMKAHTKSKRRVTLSIAGFGMLDESEVDSIPHAIRVTEDGEVIEQSAPATSSAQATEPGKGRAKLLESVIGMCGQVAALRDKHEKPPAVLRAGCNALGIDAKGTDELGVKELSALLNWATTQRDLLQNSATEPPTADESVTEIVL